ncbi:MAG TPA: GDSL-type esterase/lipase family protein [bacterium]|nr:GDSL-type esterase/lipase family protein [bacterium]
MPEPKKCKRWLKRLTLTAIVLCLLVAGVEVGLRLIGRVLYRPIELELETAQKADADEFVILCVGDSHTQGVDAPPGLSYPSQLANLLNKNHRPTRYRVINYGVPGANSSQALLRLRELYAKGGTTPAVVIVNVGKNNDHNFQEARFWLDERMKTQPLRAQLEYLLQHAKVYRLGEIAMRNLRERLTTPTDSADKYLLDEPPLLDRWLQQDYRAMIELVRANRGRVVLLNYFMPVAYVDRAMTAIAAETGAPLVDVVWFRLPRVAIRSLVGPTAHPNERGYAAVARFVLEGLQENNLLDQPSSSINE